MQTHYGVVAEWLGSALQKLLQRFESARHLKKPSTFVEGFFYDELLEEINECEKLLAWIFFFENMLDISTKSSLLN